jgi:hypothetical protein
VLISPRAIDLHFDDRDLLTRISSFREVAARN